MKVSIKDLFLDPVKYEGEIVIVEGWVRSNRNQKEFGFIMLGDGSTFSKLQVVYDRKTKNFEETGKIRFGSAVEIRGYVVLTPDAKQAFELKATEVVLIGDCPEDCPIQPKRQTKEYLRTVAHLRPRTNLFQAIFKIRSVAAMAIHTYFQENDYVYVHTPLITCADCEGSDQMFKVTTFDMNNIPKVDGKIDFSKDLFGKQSFITGSGQLQGETFAMAFKNIYTFGPTFRTENSNTKIHANEFWMIEPEMAFCDIDGLMDIEEEMLKFVISYVLRKCGDEIDFCDQFVSPGLKKKIMDLLDAPFTRISHKEVVDILKSANVRWEFEPSYLDDIAKEHEKYITEYFNGPVFITNWPKDIKAYYMKLNADNETVAAVDLVVPQAGELMGGSQREENYEKLVQRMEEMHIDKSGIDWYLDTRRYGGCPHSGFGMGFERLIMYLTGVENIRDVIPFPRTPKNCEY